MPKTTIANIADVIEVEVGDENIIQGFAAKNRFDIRTDELRLRTRIPGCFPCVYEQGLACWSDNERRIALTNVDVMDLKVPRCLGASTAGSGCQCGCRRKSED